MNQGGEVALIEGVQKKMAESNAFRDAGKSKKKKLRSLKRIRDVEEQENLLLPEYFPPTNFVKKMLFLDR